VKANLWPNIFALERKGDRFIFTTLDSGSSPEWQRCAM